MSKKKADKRKLVCSYGSKVMHSGLSLDRVPRITGATWRATCRSATRSLAAELKRS